MRIVSVKTLMSLLVVLVVALLTGSVKADSKDSCEAGDELLGPNCVHTTLRKSPRQELAASQVYRLTDGKKTIVWSGQGFVTESTEGKLIVLERANEEDRGEGEYEYRYDWDGKAYTGRQLCPEGKSC